MMNSIRSIDLKEEGRKKTRREKASLMTTSSSSKVSLFVTPLLSVVVFFSNLPPQQCKAILKCADLSIGISTLTNTHTNQH